MGWRSKTRLRLDAAKGAVGDAAGFRAAAADYAHAVLEASRGPRDAEAFVRELTYGAVGRELAREIAGVSKLSAAVARLEPYVRELPSDPAELQMIVVSAADKAGKGRVARKMIAEAVSISRERFGDWAAEAARLAMVLADAADSGTDDEVRDAFRKLSGAKGNVGALARGDLIL